MEVFVVEMLRWGERELHSYVEGVFDTEEQALMAASDAEEDRGGKYVAEVTAFVLDQRRKQIRRIKRSDKKWSEPIPEERLLKVGDTVKNLAGENGTVVEVNEEYLGIADALIKYEGREQWHNVENLEKVKKDAP